MWKSLLISYIKFLKKFFKNKIKIWIWLFLIFIFYFFYSFYNFEVFNVLNRFNNELKKTIKYESVSEEEFNKYTEWFNDFLIKSIIKKLNTWFNREFKKIDPNFTLLSKQITLLWTWENFINIYDYN